METNIKFLKPVFNVTRDTSHLSPWKQALYWRVFVPLLRFGFWLGLPVMVAPNGARVDIQCIAETDAVATAVVGAIGPSAFYIPRVPVNVTLPVQALVFGGSHAPYSPVASLFEAVGRCRDVSVICPTSGELCHPHESLRRADFDAIAKDSFDILHGVKALKAKVV